MKFRVSNNRTAFSVWYQDPSPVIHAISEYWIPHETFQTTGPGTDQVVSIITTAGVCRRDLKVLVCVEVSDPFCRILQASRAEVTSELPRVLKVFEL